MSNNFRKKYCYPKLITVIIKKDCNGKNITLDKAKLILGVLFLFIFNKLIFKNLLFI